MCDGSNGATVSSDLAQCVHYFKPRLALNQTGTPLEWPRRMGFVDLHSHVLPGLDDGSRALTDSVELTRALAGMGFDAVCATPHQRVGFFVPSRAEIDAAYDALRAAMAGAGVVLTLHLGAENFWD